MRFFSFFKRFLLDRVPRVCHDHNVARRLFVKKVALGLLFALALHGDVHTETRTRTALVTPLKTPTALVLPPTPIDEVAKDAR